MKLVSAAFIVTADQNDLGPDLVLFPALEMLKPSKPDHVFLEAGTGFRANALLLRAYGNPTIFPHPVEHGGSGEKLYLSETSSMGWEAKTPGAKRRNSSYEIATVPGTVDLVELLFSAVLMLVDWLVGSVSRSREARLWELSEFFRRSVSVEKVCWAYFCTESEALAEAPRKKAGRRKSREERDGLRI